MGKGHWPFNAACCKYHLARADTPEALCKAFLRDLPGLGDPLRQRHQIMLPIARGRGARKDASTGVADAHGGIVDPIGIQILRVAD